MYIAKILKNDKRKLKKHLPLKASYYWNPNFDLSKSVKLKKNKLDLLRSSAYVWTVGVYLFVEYVCYF